MLNAWIGDAETKASENIIKMLEAFSRKPEWLTDQNKLANVVRIFAETGKSDVGATHATMDSMLQGLFASVLRDRLAQIVQNAKWVEGMPLADRRVRLAEIDGRIDELQAQESGLIAAAAAAGVTLDRIGYAT